MSAVVVPIDSIRMPGAPKRVIGLDDLESQLCSFIDESRVLTRLIDRIAFASDASLYRLIPRAVVQPLNAEEVRSSSTSAARRKSL